MTEKRKYKVVRREKIEDEGRLFAWRFHYKQPLFGWRLVRGLDKRRQLRDIAILEARGRTEFLVDAVIG